MHKYIKIYKNGKLFKEEKMKIYGTNIFIYKWHKVEEQGAYSFKVVNKKESEEGKNVLFSHTAPFSKKFEAFVSKHEEMRPIAGFREGEDILLVYQQRDESFQIERMQFRWVEVNPEDYGYKNVKKVEMPGEFNNWNLHADELIKKDNGNFETCLALEDGVYDYKLVIDGDWVPHGENLRLIVGEMGNIFSEGEIGNGNFVYDAKEKRESRKAIKHDKKSLQYINKVSENEVEVQIRAQLQDVEKINIHLIEEDGIEEIFEMDRTTDFGYGFDYFKTLLKLRINSEKFEYYFELVDGSEKAYFGENGLVRDEVESFKIDYKSGEIPLFSVPNWAKEAVWYNIFPERFYNGNPENMPLFNEFGPEMYRKPSDDKKASLVDDYVWGAKTEKFGEYKNNSWTSDFEVEEKWEESMNLSVNYSLKYARMYGGDVEGIKKKIPYLKKLGVNAIWLNPIFFSYTNHKYGAFDFRHASPDFGTMKNTGSMHGVDISTESKHGNRSYLDVLTKEELKKSELQLLNINLKGKDKGKNGYRETEDPSTWVWTESDLIVVDLIKELHKNGMRVIFDGAFNHSGSRHWSFELALAEGEESKYADWYQFHDFNKHKKIEESMTDEEAYKILNYNRENIHYGAWAGFRDLPEFNTYNREYIEYMFNITKKWMNGPDGKASDNWMEDDGIDGWRLDVPNCVENQEFWHEWRDVVKECKADGYITAELWGDARGDINPGIKYDTVMNYEWLKTTIGYFISQGKNFDKAYKLTAEEFFNELQIKRNWYPLQALQVSQNLNGSHDTDRLLSRIVNDNLGRDLEEGKQWNKGYNTVRPDLAIEEHSNTTINWLKSDVKPKDILKLISIFQMTYIGAPMLYYGDEIGMWGATDPYCRKPMLWPEFEYNKETNGTQGGRGEKSEVILDMNLFNWYRKIIKIRKENETLIYGLFKEVLADNERDIIAYERYSDEKSYIIVMNNSFEDHEKVEISTLESGSNYIDLLNLREYESDGQGNIKLDLERKSGVILKRL